MRPDALDAATLRDAVRSARARGQCPHVDDETVAILVESGIDALAPHDRAPVLRAIGNSPDLAALVADLAPMAPRRMTFGRPAVLGISAGTWRTAWAACALLAAALTLWHVGAAPGPEVALLDGGVDGPSQDFADSLHQSLRRKTVILLWALLALLTAPALLSLRRTIAPQRVHATRAR